MASYLPLSLTFIHHQVMSISPPKSVLKPAAAKYLCSSSLSQSHYHLLLRFLQAILTSGPTSTPAPNLRFPTGCFLPVFLLPSACFHFVLSCRTVEHSEHPLAISVHLYLHRGTWAQIPSCPLTFRQTPTCASNLSPNASSVLLSTAPQLPNPPYVMPCRSSFNVCLNKYVDLSSMRTEERRA